MIIIVGSRHHKRDLRLVPTTKFYLEKEITHFRGKVFGSRKVHQGFLSSYGSPTWKKSLLPRICENGTSYWLVGVVSVGRTGYRLIICFYIVLFQRRWGIWFFPFSV